MKRKVMVGMFLCLAVLALFLFTPDSYGRMQSPNFRFAPAPILFYPVTKKIDLTGKDYLKFQWEQIDLIFTDHYDFRLYKGYVTSASNLVLRQNLSPGQYPFKVPVSQLETGQVYTWILRQVFLGGEKSDPVFGYFEIIKK